MKPKLQKIVTGIIILFLTLYILSCVPNRKVIYLRNKSAKKSFPKDSVSNTYNIPVYKYKLQPKDIFSINIASITKKELDFFDDYAERMGPILTINNSKHPIGVSTSGSNLNSNSQSRKQLLFVVNDSGYVDFPVLGLIYLKGLTMDEATLRIKATAENFFEKPLVRINLVSFQFTIFGEIQTEGIFTSYDPEINLMEAISLAGNLTEFADRGNIKIIRKENNIEKVIYVNLLNEKFLTSPYFYILPNDIIIVPPLKAKFIKKYALGNYSTFVSIFSSLAVIYFTLSRIKL